MTAHPQAWGGLRCPHSCMSSTPSAPPGLGQKAQAMGHTRPVACQVLIHGQDATVALRHTSLHHNTKALPFKAALLPRQEAATCAHIVHSCVGLQGDAEPLPAGIIPLHQNAAQIQHPTACSHSE